MKKNFDIQNCSVVPSSSDNCPIEVYISPTGEELESIEKKYDIDPHTIASALDPDEVARLELENEYNVIIWKRPRKFTYDGVFTFEVASMGIFLFRGKLLVIIDEDIPLFEKRYFHRVANITDLFLRLLSRSIVHFLGHLKVIDEISNEIKRKLNASMENKYLLQMFDLSESLVYYLNAINANGAVLNKLRNSARKLNLTSEEIDTLDDVIIDNNQCYKQAEIFSSILTGLMDARGNVINNNVNTLLKKLTLINTIFLPLNLIASIGGMSEYSVWTKGLPWEISYILFICGMVIVGLLTLIIINPGTFKKILSSKEK